MVRLFSNSHFMQFLHLFILTELRSGVCILFFFLL